MCIRDRPQYFGFADQHRVEPGADAEKMLDGFASEQRVQIRLEIVGDRSVPEMLEERFELLHAGFVIVELGVDLEASACLQHQRFAHRPVIVQRDERLAHALGRENVAFAHFDGRGVVGEAETNQRHGLRSIPLRETQAVRENRKLAREIDIADDNGLPHLQRNRREVQQRANSALRETGSNRLGRSGRHGDDSDLRVDPGQRGFERGCVLDADVLPFLSDDRWGDIENRRDFKTLLARRQKRRKRVSQKTEAGNRDAPVTF